MIIKTVNFPGGEVHVNIVSANHATRDLKVCFNLRNAQDIMQMFMQCSAIQENLDYDSLHLVIPYFPYARQDRVCASGDDFGLRMFCDMLQAIDYDTITVYDPHSDVLNALLPNLNTIEQHQLLPNFTCKYDYVVAPDAGSTKKALKCAQKLGLPLVQCLKTRDPSTGNLSGFKVCDEVKGDCLIVDDICDGGGTFVGIAEELKKSGVANIDLFVTHGIFSKGLGVFDGVIRNIFTTDSFALENAESLLRKNYPTSNSDQKCRLFVSKLNVRFFIG